jgi:hypothetical protein
VLGAVGGVTRVYLRRALFQAKTVCYNFGMHFETPNQQEQIDPNPERRRLKTMEMGAMFESAKNKFRAAGFVLATVAATAAASENLSADEGQNGVSPSDPLENAQVYGEQYFERADAFNMGPSMQRAETLAERIGIDTDNLEVHFEGQVPTEINGESVMHLLTDAEIAEVESARNLSDLMDQAVQDGDAGSLENENNSSNEDQSSDDNLIFESKPIDKNAF